MFNPMFDLPKNDEQVRIALSHDKSKLVARNLIAIYNCHIQKGKTLLEAYEASLMAHIESFQERKIEKVQK